MPTLTIDQVGAFPVASGTRLINAIIDTAKADQHYSCGGNAKCTSCRVKFVCGEPEKITQAERDLLAANQLDQQPGVRLSCQILINDDMAIQLLVPKPANKNPAHPTAEMQPSPVWLEK